MKRFLTLAWTLALVEMLILGVIMLQGCKNSPNLNALFFDKADCAQVQVLFLQERKWANLATTNWTQSQKDAAFLQKKFAKEMLNDYCGYLKKKYLSGIHGKTFTVFPEDCRIVIGQPPLEDPEKFIVFEIEDNAKTTFNSEKVK